jgi:hypothetical protein
LKRVVEREPRVALGGYAAALTLGYVMGGFQPPAADGPSGTSGTKTGLKRQPIAGDIWQPTRGVPDTFISRQFLRPAACSVFPSRGRRFNTVCTIPAKRDLDKVLGFHENRFV